MLITIDGSQPPPKTEVDIQAAIDAIKNGGGYGAVLLLPGVYTISNPINVMCDAVSLIGFGSPTRLVMTDLTADLFVVSGQLFHLERCEIQTSVTKTKGSIIDVKEHRGVEESQGVVKDVRLAGNFHDGFTFTTSRAGTWRFDNIHVPGGVKWNRLFFLRAELLKTVGSLHINNLIVSNTVGWNDAMFVLDTGVDTVAVENSELGGIGTIIHCRNSLAGGQAPRWIHFTNCFLEAGISGTGIRLDAVRDFRYGGYIASCAVGVVAGSNASEVDLSHIEFANIGQSAVKLLLGCRGVTISHNSFEDTCNAANNAYDTISVAAGTEFFRILANNFKRTTSAPQQLTALKLPRYCVYIADGKSDHYKVVLNDFADFVTGDVHNGGTGGHQVIWGN
jgi:hypothetical protein